MDQNEKKRALLGMPFGTATGKLRKALLFKLAGLQGMLNCYRCAKAIESVDDFSIEHKTAWASSTDPVKTFFDVENIAFSHPGCNSRAAANPRKTYKDAAERSRAGFSRYYEKHREQFLSRKRDRYHRDKP